MIKQILGEGTVYEKTNKYGSRYWYCEIRYIDKNGKQRRKYIKGASKRDARKNGDDFISRFNESENAYSEKTFEEMLKELLNNKMLKGVKEKTVHRERQTYEQQIKGFIGKTKMKDLNIIVIQELLNALAEKGYSRSVIKKSFDLINQCWKLYMVKSGVAYNPMDSVVLPVLKNKTEKVNFYTENELNKICEAAYMTDPKTGKLITRYGPAIVLAANTGLREGEMLALTWDDIDFENKTIKINKTVIEGYTDETGKISYKPAIQHSAKTQSGNRVIPIRPQAVEALKKLKELNGEYEYVVVTSTGNLLNSYRINNSFKLILKKTDIQVNGRTGVHTLRHSFATLLTNKGIDSETVSWYMGHSDDRITKRLYIHDKEKRAQENIEKSGLFLN